MTINASLLTFRFTSKVAALVDSKGKMVHFDLFGIGCPDNLSRNLLRPNTLRTLAARALFWGATMLDLNPLPIKAGRTTPWHGFLLKYQPIALLSRSFANNDRLRMIEDDLLEENPQKLCQAFDVIRAANILNLVYFPVDLIKQMLATLKQRLKEAGLLIVVRTRPSGENNASIFSLSDNRFVVVDRYNDGSEIESIINRC